jgi:hypothetical protein
VRYYFTPSSKMARAAISVGSRTPLFAILSDHLGKRVVPVYQTDASQRLLISRPQAADFVMFHWQVFLQ